MKKTRCSSRSSSRWLVVSGPPPFSDTVGNQRQPVRVEGIRAGPPPAVGLVGRLICTSPPGPFVRLGDVAACCPDDRHTTAGRDAHHTPHPVWSRPRPTPLHRAANLDAHAARSRRAVGDGAALSPPRRRGLRPRSPCRLHGARGGAGRSARRRSPCLRDPPRAAVAGELHDRSCRPHSSPTATPPELVPGRTDRRRPGPPRCRAGCTTTTGIDHTRVSTVVRRSPALRSGTIS